MFIYIFFLLLFAHFITLFRNMEPPIKPDESDCCNSGCNPCILDVYEEQLKKYTLKTLTNKPQSNCLSLTSYSVFKLLKKEKHTKDCNIYTFEYVRPEKVSNNSTTYECTSVIYKPGQYFLLKANLHGETFQKAYTPLYMENEAPNCFTILVKLYENGRMSRFYKRLFAGMTTLWRGPYGNFQTDYTLNNILFIAQGTGIAPFYTIICDILNNAECYTFLTLFFCCHLENVLLRNELYKLRAYWNFKYKLFIAGGSEELFETKYEEIVNFERLGICHIKDYLEKAKGGVKVLVCGSESFEENIKNMLVQCDVSNDDIKVF